MARGLSILAVGLLTSAAFPVNTRAQADIPFRVVAGHIVIVAKVNGSAVCLVVDTGASVSSFSTALKPPNATRTEAVNGFAGGRFVVELGRAEISLTSVDGKQLRATLGEVTYARGGWKTFHASGLLGLDFLRQFGRVSFDFKNRVLVLRTGRK